MHRPAPNRLPGEPLEDRVAPVVGALDPAFGTGGTTTIPFDVGGNLSDAALFLDTRSDGRVLVAGVAEAFSELTLNGPRASHDFAVARLTPMGSLDPAFGIGGKVTIPIDLMPDGDDRLKAVAIQPDGKILLAGSAQTGVVFDQVAIATRSPTRVYDLVVVRLTADGQLDTTFGTGGKTVLSFDLGESHSDETVGMSIHSDGRILVAGVAAATGGGQLVTARLTADGQLDPTFGTGGKTINPSPMANGSTLRFNTFEPLPEGGMILAGETTGGGVDFAAVRVTTTGQLDASFGTMGVAMVGFPTGGVDRALGATRQPDGRILLVGSTLPPLIDFNNPPGNRFGVVRLLADGQLDPTFGDGGRMSVAFMVQSDGGINDLGRDVVVRWDGQIIVVGDTETDTDRDFAVAVLTPAGQLDPSFGVGGKLTIGLDRGPGGPFGPRANQDVALVAALTSDGGVVMAGSASTEISGDFALARLLGDSQPVLVAGLPDGTATLFQPVNGGYQQGGGVSFFPATSLIVRVATADVTGDGVPDLIGGTGAGTVTQVRVIDGATRQEVATLRPFEVGFVGGVFVAAGDIDGDGKAEVVVTADRDGGPVVVIYGGAGLTTGQGDAAQLTRFLGIEDPNFRGGARPALGDVNGDGKADLIVSAGFGGGPRIALFDGAGLLAPLAPGALPPKLVGDFFAFEGGLRNGAFVAAGDTTGDGKADLAFSGGPGGGPRVRMFDGAGLLAAGSFTTLDEIESAQVANFFAGDETRRGGVRITLRDADGNRTSDLITGSGESEPSRVQVYLAGNLLGNLTPSPDQVVDPFSVVLPNGVFVG